MQFAPMTTTLTAAHAIGDPMLVNVTEYDPIVLAGLRAIGDRVRVCIHCGSMVLPDGPDDSDWRHVTHHEARIILR